MSLLNNLEIRCENKCELCNNTGSLSAYLVPPKVEEITENQVAICSTCSEEIQSDDKSNTNHWRCLTESMWSQHPAVQALSYQLLKRVEDENWAQDALSQMYLDETTKEWAEAGLSSSAIVHKDSNGNVLAAGDTVTLIQDLNVKGAGFTAKRGTAVRKIRLVHDNPEHIEGKVDGQQIVILTKYVKKS